MYYLTNDKTCIAGINDLSTMFEQILLNFLLYFALIEKIH